MNRVWVIAILLAVSVGAGAVTYIVKNRTQRLPELSEIRWAMADQDYAKVAVIAQQRLKRIPGEIDSLLLLGEAAQRQERWDDALQAYAEIPLSADKEAVAARVSAVSIALQLGRLEQAEQFLKELDQVAGPLPVTDDQWVSVLTLSGQRYRSLPYLQRIAVSGRATLSHAIFLANPDDMPAPPDELFAKIYAVGDPLGLLGAAYTAAALGRDEQAHQLLDRVLKQRPELWDAYVLRGRLQLDAGEFEAFNKSLDHIPDDVRSLPGYWMNLGRAAHLQGDLQGAIRCYWETLRLQPNHDGATYQIGQALAAIGERETAERFLARGKLLSDLQKQAVDIFDGQQAAADLWNCAHLCQKLGRLPEASLWSELLLERFPTYRPARLMLQSLQRDWPSPPPLLLAEQNLAVHFDGNRYPVPQLATLAVSRPTKPSPSAPQTSAVRFEDVAGSSGLDFTYFSGEDLSTPGKRMFEYTGGGVAVLDFELDGWPDLYFTQGSPYPGKHSRPHDFRDALFRNRAGHQWQPVADQARIRDDRFGQGVAAADYNNDGFPDLYLANIDGNRLYRNNGDGTFEDVTEEAGLGHQYWTTSCLVADINRDAVPDIYDVTFLLGDDIYDRTCKGSDGVARSCDPAGFDAAPDVVYLGRGDGTFQRLSDEAGFAVPEGDGLGIVAADFDHSGRLSLFVANDGRPNFYFVPVNESGSPARWEEQGVLSGLAFDDSGKPQASMGVAASDANNDGLTDLYVTNFYLESNAFYVNLGGDTFSDQARSTGLREPSVDVLGFGTQFLDADLDGWDDLMVANGHVDDFSYKGLPYKMPTQFLANHAGRFREQSAPSLGTYFEFARLGRGMSTLDGNRDGKTDVVISNIGDPAAYLMNNSQTTGCALAFHMRGVSGARDAIGTRVIVTVDGMVRERQITAGDGYQASNERRLVFGLGVQTPQATAHVEILWPQGQRQIIEQLAIPGEYFVVEGQSPVTRRLSLH